MFTQTHCLIGHDPRTIANDSQSDRSLAGGKNAGDVGGGANFPNGRTQLTNVNLAKPVTSVSLAKPIRRLPGSPSKRASPSSPPHPWRALLSAISEQETVLLPWRCLAGKETRGIHILPLAKSRWSEGPRKMEAEILML
ncbi:hypothetical protein KM043_009296 [Ampulex compressa]|nr:hypothetical protein KM043_009296 [Ampulex compressa]